MCFQFLTHEDLSNSTGEQSMSAVKPDSLRVPLAYMQKKKKRSRGCKALMKGNKKGVPNERRRQSLRIRKPDSIAKKPEPRVHKSSKKSKKSKKSKTSRLVREPVRAPSVESLSASDESEREGSDREGSEREVINSVLVPTIGKQIMLARIIDEEREYDCQGSPSDTWNYWLNVKQKNIWWKELYELDQAARGVLPKNKDKEKVTFAEGSSSNSGLDSRLQGLEERILEFMGEGFVGLHTWIFDSGTMVHMKRRRKLILRRTKLMLSKRLGKRRITSRILSKRLRENMMKKKGKRKRLMTMLSKRKEKENSEADEQDTEDSESESESESEDDQAEVEGKEDQEEEVVGKESETREQEKEKSETDEVESEAREAEIEKGTPTPPRGNQTEESPKDDHNEPRVETNRTDETPTPPRGNQTEETPTPPRGRTKAMAARRLVTRPMEEEPGKGVEVVAEEAVETEGKSRKKVAEEENKEEEAVKEQAGEIVEEYTEEEKQRWIIAVYKEAPSPWIMHRCKENAAVAVPKKSGRPKKKSQWVQTPFTEGKKRKTKTYAYVWKTKFTGVTMPKNE
ncbi:LOW QUALITY PROTEIN: hypothetical protein HID58_069456 [Brassica napus]|uniref:DUF287 domain-containing protein n=1 Tax=Brassica napus TaxID=3708 RepID=A0ABQ7YVX5_BRANA|nr:LOW QUALITY PROTEIN: hypothetical protein HID58_069456 [Brassica napus]